MKIAYITEDKLQETPYQPGTVYIVVENDKIITDEESGRTQEAEITFDDRETSFGGIVFEQTEDVNYEGANPKIVITKDSNESYGAAIGTPTGVVPLNYQFIEQQDETTWITKYRLWRQRVKLYFKADIAEDIWNIEPPTITAININMATGEISSITNTVDWELDKDNIILDTDEVLISSTILIATPLNVREYNVSGITLKGDTPSKDVGFFREKHNLILFKVAETTPIDRPNNLLYDFNTKKWIELEDGTFNGWDVKLKEPEGNEKLYALVIGLTSNIIPILIKDSDWNNPIEIDLKLEGPPGPPGPPGSAGLPGPKQGIGLRLFNNSSPLRNNSMLWTPGWWRFLNPESFFVSYWIGPKEVEGSPQDFFQLFTTSHDKKIYFNGEVVYENGSLLPNTTIDTQSIHFTSSEDIVYTLFIDDFSWQGYYTLTMNSENDLSIEILPPEDHTVFQIHAYTQFDEPMTNWIESWEVGQNIIIEHMTLSGVIFQTLEIVELERVYLPIELPERSLEHSYTFLVKILTGIGQNDAVWTQEQLVTRSTSGLGPPGPLGPTAVFKGTWDVGATYINTNAQRDVVFKDGDYYILEGEVESTGDDPTLGAPWVKFTFYQYIASKIAITSESIVRENITIGDGQKIVISGLDGNNPYISIAQDSLGFNKPGVYIENDGGLSRFSIGDSSNNEKGYFNWNGNVLKFRSNKVVGESGTYGTVTIDENELRFEQTNLGDVVLKTVLGADGVEVNSKDEAQKVRISQDKMRFFSSAIEPRPEISSQTNILRIYASEIRFNEEDDPTDPQLPIKPRAKLSYISDPTEDHEAATKRYVDGKLINPLNNVIQLDTGTTWNTLISDEANENDITRYKIEYNVGGTTSVSANWTIIEFTLSSVANNASNQQAIGGIAHGTAAEFAFISFRIRRNGENIEYSLPSKVRLTGTGNEISTSAASDIYIRRIWKLG